MGFQKTLDGTMRFSKAEMVEYLLKRVESGEAKVIYREYKPELDWSDILIKDRRYFYLVHRMERDISVQQIPADQKGKIQFPYAWGWGLAPREEFEVAA